jgi:hypothetical protein
MNVTKIRNRFAAGVVGAAIVAAPVSAPIVWGQYDSPTYLLND